MSVAPYSGGLKLSVIKMPIIPINTMKMVGKGSGIFAMIGHKQVVT